MQFHKARPYTPLQLVQQMRPQDGSPLPLAGHLRGHVQLQGIPTISVLHLAFLLAVLCYRYGVRLARHLRRD